MILGAGGRINGGVPYSTAKEAFRSGSDKVDQVILGTGDMKIVKNHEFNGQATGCLKKERGSP